MGSLKLSLLLIIPLFGFGSREKPNYSGHIGTYQVTDTYRIGCVCGCGESEYVMEVYPGKEGHKVYLNNFHGIIDGAELSITNNNDVVLEFTGSINDHFGSTWNIDYGMGEFNHDTLRFEYKITDLSKHKDQKCRTVIGKIIGIKTKQYTH